ncbi:MAG: DUF1501 domain-containing protein [Gammaproteobacteria bacterium]
MTAPRDLKRRDFIRRGLSGAAALSMSGLGGLLPSREARAQPAGFKALVFLFLTGGNDSYNTLVPTSGGLRTRYEQGRGFIALPSSDLHAISLVDPVDVFDGTTAGDFGFHPNCPQLAQMFNAGELNIMCNAGNMVTPVDRAAYNNETVALPPQLFSHADQQRQLQSEPSNPFRYGWGGRMAELLTAFNTDPLVSPLITLSGLNAFQVSRDSVIAPYGLSNDGALALARFDGLRAAMMENSMSAATTAAGLLAQKYADVFQSARTAEVIVRAAFDAAEATGVDYDAIFQAAGGTDTRTQRRLKTVAKMIAGRGSTANLRPIYFVEMRGYDTHQNVLGAHAALMADLDASIKGFRDALVAQGDFDSVVTMVGSEFGRTFTPNGNNLAAGSDHGWGGHMLFMGGAVDGGRLLGIHPDFRLNQGLDTGRGRWIPTTSTSQCAAELARWMDVPEVELLSMFPTLVNFGGAPAPAIIA